MFQHQVYAWEIFSPNKTARFCPKDHYFYSV